MNDKPEVKSEINNAVEDSGKPEKQNQKVKADKQEVLPLAETTESPGLFDRRRLKDLPEQPGIYIMKNTAGDIIYVGKAVNLKNRVRQYFQNARNNSVKTNALVSHISTIETIVVSSELEALILECNLIKKNMPRYNICLKDGKTYPYIGVTLGESYPRVLFTREKKKDGTRYFGPFTSAFAVKKTIEAIGRIYPIRLCNRKTEPGTVCGRPCLNYHIGRCCAPCTGKIDKQIYDGYISEIIEILEGNADGLLGRLETRMKEAAAVQDFESAAELRDQLQGVSLIVEKQKIISEGGHDQDLIAVYKDRDLACVQILNIRGGQLIGRDHIFTDDVLEESEQDIITAFAKQYYVNRAFIPGEIIFNERLAENEIEPVQEWLSELRGARTKLTFPQRGQKTKLAAMAEENARLTLEQYEAQRMRKVEKESGRTRALKDFLGMEKDPENIEAYDISNIAGTSNVGGMVVFRGTRPDKKSYRRFKIESVDGQDDYASMQEMIFRRVERGVKEQESGTTKSSFLPFPDIMAIDGGKTHVNAVKSILEMYPQLNIEVIGLVKDDHHNIRGLIYEGEEYPLKFATPLCSYMSEISEEVHRYALAYHKTLRRKSMLESRLEEIPGIGKKRREVLMRHFGNLKNIQEASEEEIAQLPGMSTKTAEAVYTYFRQENQ
ncbi:MAG: excinuclease ABC subunit UvrC [Eubacteriaceae bacterium]